MCQKGTLLGINRSVYIVLTRKTENFSQKFPGKGANLRERKIYWMGIGGGIQSKVEMGRMLWDLGPAFINIGLPTRHNVASFSKVVESDTGRFQSSLRFPTKKYSWGSTLWDRCFRVREIMWVQTSAFHIQSVEFVPKSKNRSCIEGKLLGSNSVPEAVPVATNCFLVYWEKCKGHA